MQGLTWSSFWKVLLGLKYSDIKQEFTKMNLSESCSSSSVQSIILQKDAFWEVFHLKRDAVFGFCGHEWVNRHLLYSENNHLMATPSYCQLSLVFELRQWWGPACCQW